MDFPFEADRRTDSLSDPASNPSQLRYHDYLHKRHLVNPKKSGPFHFRAPSRIFYKAIRGMIPHKVRLSSLDVSHRRARR